MKHLLLISCLFTGLSFGANAQKFGHIDAQNLLLNLPERSDAEVKLQSTAQEFDNQLVSMQSDLQNKYQGYQENAATWPDALREQKEREIQALDQGLQEFAQTVQGELATLEQTLLTPMIERVQKAILEVGKDHNFTYIFDSSMGATLYNGGVDVTDLVRDELGM